MNLKNAFIWFSAAGAGALAIGARAYKYFYTQESAHDYQLSNRLLTQTLQDVYRAASAPNNQAILSAVSNTGLSLLSAYLSDTQRQAPLRAAVRARAPLVEVDNSLEKQLRDSGYNMNNLPEQFCDPITFELMTDPVTAFTQCQNSVGQTIRTAHVYDRKTYEQLGGICPENRLPFVSRLDNVELKTQFVGQEVQRRQMNLRA